MNRLRGSFSHAYVNVPSLLANQSRLCELCAARRINRSPVNSPRATNILQTPSSPIPHVYSWRLGTNALITHDRSLVPVSPHHLSISTHIPSTLTRFILFAWFVIVSLCPAVLPVVITQWRMMIVYYNTWMISSIAPIDCIRVKLPTRARIVTRSSPAKSTSRITSGEQAHPSALSSFLGGALAYTTWLLL